MANGTVYYYLPGPVAWEGKLRQALAIQGLRMKKLEAEDAGETVGYLVGIKGFEKAAEGTAVQPPEVELMILHGITGVKLEGALRAFLKVGVPRSVYKSIVTAENAKWNLPQLCEELKREREAMDAGAGGAHTGPED